MPNPRKPRTFIPSKYTRYTVAKLERTQARITMGTNSMDIH